MQSTLQIETSFDKKPIDACNSSCLSNNGLNFLTPNEISCFSECTKKYTRERFASYSSIDLNQGPVFVQKKHIRSYFQ